MSEYHVGDLVVVHHDGEDQGAVVSKPVSPDETGQVLLYDGGVITGLEVSHEDLELADKDVGDWAQLAHTLIKLGSHIIEERLLIYRG